MPDESMKPMVDLMEQEWSVIDELLSSLAPEEWSAPTECPEWTVKDQLAHLNGNETLILGLAEGDEGSTDMAVANAAQVASRRPRSPEDLLTEFRSLVEKRLGVLRSMEAADWDEPRPAPPGPIPGRLAIRFRIFDAWTHEQDVRRAVGRPGHTSGAAAALGFEMMRSGMPYVVGKRAGAPEGTTVRFDVVGGPATPFAVGIVDGRGVEVDAPERPDVTITVDFETFMRVTGGRITAAAAIDSGNIRIAGDAELARRVLENATLVP